MFTIGYSTQDAIENANRLIKNGVKTLVDVRSSPYSKYNPSINREPFKAFLAQKGIRYVYLGNLLGGLDKNNEKPGWQVGLDKLREIVEQDPTACIMCSEGKYQECHRYYWISKDLENEMPIHHILKDGSTEKHKIEEVALSLF